MPYYYVRYGGEVYEVVRYRSGQPTVEFLEKLNPFSQIGYNEGLLLYNDSSKWTIHIDSPEGPVISLTNIIRDHGCALDVEDGKIYNATILSIKRSVLYGYPLKTVYHSYAIEMIIKYNRRRFFRNYFVHTTWLYKNSPVTDLTMIKDIIREYPISATKYVHDLRAAYVYYVITNKAPVHFDITIRDKIMMKPIIFFALSPMIPSLLTGLYEGLENAVRIL